MERLTGLDATMLYTETPTAHMHTLKVAVLDPTDMDGGYDRDRLVDELESRFGVLEQFRRRLVRVPLSIHHPVWIEDPDFDIDNHVHAMEVDSPGGPAELDDVLSKIHAQPLRRDRPLWEMTLITGLAHGHVAVAAKIHHALADGMAAVTALVEVGAPEPTASVERLPDAWEPERVPGRPALLGSALADRVRSARKVPELLGRTVRGSRAKRRRGSSFYDKPPAPLSCPTPSINGTLTARRAVATAKIPLADFKTVKDRFGCTLNDVLLATTAGALRSLLSQRGEPLDRPLICAVPVSIDPGDAPKRTKGNRTGQLFTSLRTDVADPVQRLHAIHHVTKNAKILNTELGPELTHDWNEFASSGIYQLLWKRLMPRVARASVNIVVSNVPGPREPIYFAGARMVDFYSASVLTEGVGHNVTVWSYLDHLYVGYTTCPDLLPRAHEFTHAMQASLIELVDAAESKARR